MGSNSVVVCPLTGVPVEALGQLRGLINDAGFECLEPAPPGTTAPARVRTVPVCLLIPEHAEPSQWQPQHTGPVLGVFLGALNPTTRSFCDRLQDFLCWPCSAAELAARVRRLQVEPEATMEEHGIVGSCASLRKVQSVLQRYQRCKAPVLILGESGTGKELVARALHYPSARSQGPFIPVNCGALPDDLLENELFGHERGAFTGARDKSLGLVEQAQAGTLFLDEVGTLSSKGQCALLRFLQSQEFKRLGAPTVRHADVRVLAATNADLHALAKQGKFREDLLYRLDILSVTLPPLRERGTDIERLAEHFIQRYGQEYQLPTQTLGEEARAWLYQYHWPGNVRELENLVHRAVLLSTTGVISLADISPFVESEVAEEPGPYTTAACSVRSFQAAKAEVIENFERGYLTHLMEHAAGNVSEAARIAGKERRALGKLLKKHGIDRRHFDLG